MKRNTITWRILQYNLIIILSLAFVVGIAFNLIIRSYIHQHIQDQLQRTSSKVTHFLLTQTFESMSPEEPRPPVLNDRDRRRTVRFYSRFIRSLRQPLSFMNADYLMLDSALNPIDIFEEEASLSHEIILETQQYIQNSDPLPANTVHQFYSSDEEYLSIIQPIQSNNLLNIAWLVVYSNIEHIKNLQKNINLILFGILFLSGLLISLLSTKLSKKISHPLSALNQHIRGVSQRNFSQKLNLDTTDEFQELISNVNRMTHQLETYDKAQKVFLENVSHEFRTPLMSIQSYAEGIQHQVTDVPKATIVIIEETQRLKKLVEDLLYLSRLDALKEEYNFNKTDIVALIKNCLRRFEAIATSKNIVIQFKATKESYTLILDEDKMIRSITNLLDNCIRHAQTCVQIQIDTPKDSPFLLITIQDDGDGFSEENLNQLFERFYKGRKGLFGLGLSISKSVIEKHQGQIHAKNAHPGAIFEIQLPLKLV